MNGKAAKLIRRVKKDSHKGKREWNALTHLERGEVSADYKIRGTLARAEYTENKKKVKKEKLGE